MKNEEKIQLNAFLLEIEVKWTETIISRNLNESVFNILFTFISI